MNVFPTGVGEWITTLGGLCGGVVARYAVCWCTDILLGCTCVVGRCALVADACGCAAIIL